VRHVSIAIRDRCFIVTLAVALLTTQAQPAPGAAARQSSDPGQPTVLFLSPDDFTRPYVRLLFAAFSDVLLAAPSSPVIYFEAVDLLRFEEPQYLEDLREWLQRKYHDRRIDLVVALGEDVVGFLAETRGEPWPAAQVLYLEAGSIRVDTRRTLPRAGGMLLEDHFSAAIEVIEAILPRTRRVALVYGASAVERARFSGFADKVRHAGLEPIEMVGKTMEQTRDEVGRLPPDTVVMVLAPTVDGTGHVVPPSQACELLASAQRAPVFTLAAHDLGCGVVGGLLRDWTIVGRLLGEEVLARVKRASTDVVTVPIARYTALAFDDRQLERWGIAERRLPAGAAVQFRERNLWRDHRALVLVALGVTLVQSALIAGLVFERRRRRQAEIDSRRHLAAMAHMDRRAAMGELATSLAHELNQPLNAILQNAGVAQMLLTSSAVPAGLGEMGEIISDIRKDDIRASEVLRRMRGLLQKHELESRPVDLNDVAQETIAIVRPDALSREIQLDVDLAETARPILGDRVHLQQVLLNLLMNAMDAVAAMPAERRRVRVRTSQRDGEIRLAVADTGTGIPADRISKIFEPFYTTKTEGQGMGMGLAIARSIVEAHGGRMSAENNGGGATVWFSLPVSQ
jgi:signal transduction histidine kinase